MLTTNTVAEGGHPWDMAWGASPAENGEFAASSPFISGS